MGHKERQKGNKMSRVPDTKGTLTPMGVFSQRVICIQTRNCGAYKLRPIIEDLQGKTIKCKRGHLGPVKFINLE